jgi:acetyl-CoA acyltransferase
MAKRFEKDAHDPVIVAGCRTPVGKIRGALASVRPDDMLGLVFKEALARAGTPGAAIDEAFAGCANQAGEDNRNIARMGLLLAGLPDSVPAVTVNRLCASGLEAVVAASRMIRTGEGDVVLAGGVESMTRAPFAMAKPDVGFMTGAPAVFDTSLGWRFPNARLAELFPLEQMGETAENLVDEYKLTRDEQDRFAVASHAKAVRATAEKWNAHEIVPIVIKDKKSETVVSVDEGPRADSTIESLAKLKPAFRKDGSVTAGNSSTLNDGAAALVLMSRRRAERDGKAILGVVRGAASAGVSPRTMGIGPVPAVEKLLARTGLSTSDVDVFELNEAFAAQSLACIKALSVDENRVNLHGGAIAIGHPLGCSGARVTISLLSVLARTGGTLGVATLCVGVGQGLAVLVERDG